MPPKPRANKRASCGFSYTRREAILDRDEITRAVCDVFGKCPSVVFPLTNDEWVSGRIQCAICGQARATVWCRACRVPMCASCSTTAACMPLGDNEAISSPETSSALPLRAKSRKFHIRVRSRPRSTSLDEPPNATGDGASSSSQVPPLPPPAAKDSSIIQALPPPAKGHAQPLLQLPQSFRAQERIQIYVLRHAEDAPFFADTLTAQIAARIGLDTTVAVTTVHQDSEVHVLELHIATIVVTSGIDIRADYPSQRAVLQFLIGVLVLVIAIRCIDIIAWLVARRA